MNMLKKRLKTELRIVHLTSDDNVFLNEKKAMKHEWLLSNKREVTRKESKMIEDKLKSIVKVLSRREWGIFFKGEPMESFPTQDGIKMYKVNEIAPDRLFDALKNESRQMEKEWQDNSEQQTEGESSNG